MENESQRKAIYDLWESKGYLSYLRDEKEKKAVAVLLDNTQRLYQSNEKTDVIKQSLTESQALWLTKEAWIRCKLKDAVEVQPMLGPSSVVYFFSERQVRSDTVVSATESYCFELFVEQEFETMKHLYASTMARELDRYIFSKLPFCNVFAMVDMTKVTHIKFSDYYDYIVGTEKCIQELRESGSCEGVDMISMDAVLEPESFEVKGAAGRYTSKFEAPVFAPYLLLAEIASTRSGTRKIYFKSGWYTGASKQSP